jgi:hypothetical protein
MSNYINYLATSRTYTYLWGKYRPAILKLMLDSADAPQQYKFSEHEIKTASPKEKGGYTFTLKLHKGKAVNDIRTSVIAKDLLAVLQQSGKALELAENSTYEFKLDRRFVLHVVKEQLPKEVAAEEPAVIPEPVEG